MSHSDSNLYRCIYEDDLHLIHTPYKDSPSRSINKLADFFVELYLSLEAGSLDEFLVKIDNVLTRESFYKIISGQAYIDPISFQYFKMVAPFFISPLKLSKLNLNIMKSTPCTEVIDFDSKLLWKLCEENRKEKNKIRRKKAADYRKLRYEQNPEPFLESARKMRKKLREKREVAEKVCPAYLLYLNMRKNRDAYVAKKIFYRKDGKLKTFIEHIKRPAEFGPSSFLWSKSPIKMKSKCEAIKNSDFKLCHFIRSGTFIQNHPKCDMKNFLQYFSLESELLIDRYIKKIKQKNK